MMTPSLTTEYVGKALSGDAIVYPGTSSEAMQVVALHLDILQLPYGLGQSPDPRRRTYLLRRHFPRASLTSAISRRESSEHDERGGS